MVAGIDVAPLPARRRAQAPRAARARARRRRRPSRRADGRGRARRRRCADSEAGARWLADFERTKEPWFYFSYGNGFYHHHRSWIDDPALPIATIGSYIERLEAGEDISRPLEAVIAERDRITAEYRALLPRRDDVDGLRREPRRSRARSSRTSRATTSTSSTGTTRSSGTRCASSGRCSPPRLPRRTQEDVFFLRHDEVAARSTSCGSPGPAASGAPRARATGRRSCERRKAIKEAMRGGRRRPRSAPCPRRSPSR